MIKYLLPNPTNINVWMSSMILVLGILFFNWRPEVVIYAYLFETIIIGLLHIIKMLFIYLFSDKKEEQPKSPNEVSGFFLIPFFIFHYYFFVAIQMVFVFLFLNVEKESGGSGFNLFKNFIYLFSQADMREAYLVIIASNIFHVMRTFFIPLKYKDATMSETFMQPYLRVFVQQFVAILGGFIFMFTGGALGVAILLIVFKTFIDLLGVSLPQYPELREKLIDWLNSNNEKLSEEEKNKAREQIKKFFE